MQTRQGHADMNCLQGYTRMITENPTTEKFAIGIRIFKLSTRYHWFDIDALRKEVRN